MTPRLICVTNRLLCTQEPFLQRVRRIASALGKNGRILLREKDLPLEEARKISDICYKICVETGAGFGVNSHIPVASSLGCPVHLPLPLLRDTNGHLPATIPQTGVSVHSVEEAREACRLGAGYLIAGHIFPTQCKAGLAARGLRFLEQVVQATPLPVYAIGGITPENGAEILRAGAAGLCVMSRWMTHPQVEEDIARYAALWK